MQKNAKTPVKKQSNYSSECLLISSERPLLHSRIKSKRIGYFFKRIIAS